MGEECEETISEAEEDGHAHVHMVGGEKDENGCLASAGYTWCGAKGKCLRPWEEECEETNPEAEEDGHVHVHMVGGETDENGCLASAGYTWCGAKGKPCDRGRKSARKPWRKRRKSSMNFLRTSLDRRISKRL